MKFLFRHAYSLNITLILKLNTQAFVHDLATLIALMLQGLAWYHVILNQ